MLLVITSHPWPKQRIQRVSSISLISLIPLRQPADNAYHLLSSISLASVCSFHLHPLGMAGLLCRREVSKPPAGCFEPFCPSLSYERGSKNYLFLRLESIISN